MKRIPGISAGQQSGAAEAPRSLLPPSGQTHQHQARSTPSKHLGLAQSQASVRNIQLSLETNTDPLQLASAYASLHGYREPPFNTEAPRRPPCVAPSASRVCPHPSSKHLPAPSVSWHQLPPWLQPSVLGQLPTCCSRPGTSWASLSRLQEGHRGGAGLWLGPNLLHDFTDRMQK